MVTNRSHFLMRYRLENGQFIQRSVQMCEEYVFVDSGGTIIVKLTHYVFCFFIVIYPLAVEVIGGTEELTNVVLARVAFLVAV